MRVIHWRSVCMQITSFTTVAAVAASLGAVAYAVVEWKATQLAEACKEDTMLAAAGARLAKAHVSVGSVVDARASIEITGPVVKRSREDFLASVYFRQTRKYYMVVGPKGCGKTVMAVAAASKREGDTLVPRDGVLWVMATHKDADKLILTHLHPSDLTTPAYEAMVSKWAGLPSLIPVFQAAAIEYKRTHPDAPVDWVPTVIFEMDRNLAPRVIAEVCRTAKWLACETKLAAVVLVLSDAGTTGIPPDAGRQVCVLSTVSVPRYGSQTKCCQLAWHRYLRCRVGFTGLWAHRDQGNGPWVQRQLCGTVYVGRSPTVVWSERPGVACRPQVTGGRGPFHVCGDLLLCAACRSTCGWGTSPARRRTPSWQPCSWTRT